MFINYTDLLTKTDLPFDQIKNILVFVPPPPTVSTESGQTSVITDAEAFKFILQHEPLLKHHPCIKKAVNFPVVVIGFGTDSKHGDYWILRSHSGTNWGEKYFTQNLCHEFDPKSYPSNPKYFNLDTPFSTLSNEEFRQKFKFKLGTFPAVAVVSKGKVTKVLEGVTTMLPIEKLLSSLAG